MRYSLGILKPDCVQRGLEDRVYAILAQNGFHIVAEKRLVLTRQDVETVYVRCSKADFFEDMAEFLVSGEVVVVVVKDGTESAIDHLNHVVGHTEPALAESGTVRSLGESIRRNLMHSTQNEETFWKEAQHLFSQDELIAISRG